MLLHSDNRLRDVRRIGIGRLKLGQAFECNRGQICGWAPCVFIRSGLIGRLSGMEEVIRALGECARHDNRSFNAQARQLRRVTYRQ
jgi:hypothetical protein